MNRYEGVNCPVCGNPFTENDTIIVCPNCGTPHHAECYRAAGKCAHEDWHASGKKFELPKQEKAQNAPPHTERENDDDQTRSQNDASVCPRCGAPCASNAMFCQQCGFPVGQFRAAQAQRQNPDSQQNPYQHGASGAQFVYGGMVPPYAGLNPDEELTEGITVREYASFIGPAAPQYLLRFKRMVQRGKSISWNFLFGIGNAFYCCYRKMYKIGIPLMIYLALYVGVYLTSSIMTMHAVSAQLATSSAVTMDTIYMLMESAMAGLPSWLLNAFTLLRFLLLPIMLFFALFGDKLYFNYCTKAIQAIKRENPNMSNMESGESAALIGKKGGVNRKLLRALLLLALVAFTLVPFMSAFLMM